MLRKTGFPEDVDKRINVRTLLRAETPVTRPLQGGAEDAASRPRHGAEAWLRLCDEETYT